MGSKEDQTNEEESEVNQGTDELLSHDFDVVQADENGKATNDDNARVERVRGWKPISHRIRDLTIDYFRKLRARALPPLMETPSENEGTGISS